ncbi:MAG: glycosyltransferase [Chitinophagaceae bacterium]|nr:glycosyltransferase [Chitinophagaceae bacterium]
MLNIFKVAYRQANHLIACGSDMAVLFEKKGIERSRISVITNWADHEEVFPDNLINANRNIYFNVDLNNKIVIEFAGNIGRVQGLDSFVALFLKVNNPCLRLVIIGNGAFKDKVKNLAQKNGAINKSILFFESKPRSEQVIFLNSCDIGLVTLCEGMYGLGVPSKIYNIMAAGKPVLYIGDAGSEIFEYVKKQDIGWGFSWDESEKIIHFLKTLNIAKYGEICEKGSKARAFVECEYTEEKIIDKYVSIVNH